MGMATILVMWPEPLNKVSFPHPIDGPYEIWLWLAQWFLRRCLKSVEDGGLPILKALTNEPSAPMS